jgi:hypothetical protein
MSTKLQDYKSRVLQIMPRRSSEADYSKPIANRYSLFSDVRRLQAPV